MSKKDIEVNVAQTQAIDFPLKVAPLAETVNVTGASPLIQTTASSVGAVVDVKRIESLPLNGRQFANLAATVPGVGLGFHTDPTKSTQYAPQINGGNGRNVNYQIDGGDNNDDTVGGLLQQFPLEAIQEFNFQTQRFKAEYGRSNGGVLNVVTKSGTNHWSGSVFEFFRDKSMNALTQTEKLRATLPTSRTTAATSSAAASAGRSRRTRRTSSSPSSARSRTRRRRSTPQGLFPDKDGVFAVPYRENLVTGKVTANLNAAQYLSVRYGRNNNSQPYGAARQQHVRQLGRQQEQVQLDQPQPQLGAGRVEAERVHLPVRRLPQPHRVAHLGAQRDASRTASPSAPTATRRRRPSRRSISSATTSRGT